MDRNTPPTAASAALALNPGRRPRSTAARLARVRWRDLHTALAAAVTSTLKIGLVGIRSALTARRSSGTTSLQPVEFLPQDVQLRIALARSTKETGNPLMCQEANCSNPAAGPGQTAYAGGSSLSGPAPSQNMNGGELISDRSFARPLNENYARGYLSRHLNVVDANSKLEAEERSKEVTDNSVHIVVWAAVRIIARESNLTFILLRLLQNLGDP
ncbi:hypothetical protein B0H14DRAFT_3446319 [Mycena olivaceomarginata]|nr:hypothetical protein B0H14DRAFT_3446319 [Mycena olivaceomarginata]